MKISDVLRHKGRRIVTVFPSKPALDLPRMFDDNAISALPVADASGAVIGIVTDRSYIQDLARRHGDMFRLTAADIMVQPAPTCTPEDSVSDVLRTMTEERIRHLIVLIGGRPAGIVSIGDLVREKLADVELESRVLREMALGHLAAE